MADAAPRRPAATTPKVATRLVAHALGVRVATGKRGKPDLDAYLAYLAACARVDTGLTATPAPAGGNGLVT
jgi:hypothetical protein